MNNLKYNISLIILDLNDALCKSVLTDDTQAIKEIKEALLLLEKYDRNEVSYANIISLLIQICIARYDIVKAFEHEKTRYVIFNIRNSWISFIIDETCDNVWKEVKQLEKNQDQKCINLAINASKYFSELEKSKSKVISTLRDFYKNPTKHKFKYLSDILRVEDIYISPTGEYSTGDWTLKDNNYYDLLPDDLKKANKAFYLMHNPKGKKIN